MRQHSYSLLLVLCLWVVASLAADSLSDTILSQGVDGYWRLGETSGTVAYDASGHGVNGSYAGSYTLGTPGIVDTNGALRVNGGYMRVSNFAMTPSFTILVWGKSATSTWNTWGWLASARVPNGFIIHPDNGGKSVSMYIISNASGSDHTGIGSVSVSDITAWHQYGITYNAVTQVAGLILDGQIVSSTSYTGTRTTGAISMDFGEDYGISGRMGNGSIDEVALFNEELTAGQIVAQYNAATNPVPEPTSLVLLSLSSLIYFCFLRKERS